MADFPLEGQQDSKYYGVEAEDPAVRSDMEGGYVASRPRFTRTPRKTFTTGFTSISNADRATLEAFWDAKKGGAVVFTWLNPVDGTTHTVRFKEPMTFKYAGLGGVHLWNVTSIVLEEA